MQIIQMLMQSRNPQQMLQNMMNNNPQMKAIFNQARNSGMSMEQFARQYAKQNNIDIDSMLNNIRQMGTTFK